MKTFDTVEFCRFLGSSSKLPSCPFLDAKPGKNLWALQSRYGTCRFPTLDDILSKSEVPNCCASGPLLSNHESEIHAMRWIYSYIDPVLTWVVGSLEVVGSCFHQKLPARCLLIHNRSWGAFRTEWKWQTNHRRVCARIWKDLMDWIHYPTRIFLRVVRKEASSKVFFLDWPTSME